MKWARILMAAVFAATATLPANAVIVDISQITEGTPAPGTTISLETPEGELIDLEVELTELEEIIETGTPETPETPQTTTTETPPSTVTETTTPPVVEETPPATTVPEKKTVTALPVPEDGQIQFTVDDRYKDRPLVYVVRDGTGSIIERRSITLTGTVVTVTASSLPVIAQSGIPATTATGTAAQPAVTTTPQTVSGTQQPGTQYEPTEQTYKYRYHIGWEIEAGRMSRDSFSALRTQNAGTIVNDRFAAIDRDGDFTSVMFDGQFDLGVGAPVGGGSLYAIGSFRYGTSSADSYQTNVPSGGNDLALLAPQGPTGILGGGALVGAANADLNFLSYSDRYDEYMAQLGLMTMIGHGPFMITPRGLLFYGRTEESIDYRGRTNSNTLDFDYNVQTDSNRFGLQLGSELAYTTHDIFTFFFGADARFIHNSAESTASLALSGALNHFETVTATKDFFDVGGILEGGVRFQDGRFSGGLGVRWESWQIPVAQITGERPLYIDEESRNSFSAFARFNIALGQKLAYDINQGLASDFGDNRVNRGF